MLADFDGDGRLEVTAVTSSGDLALFPRDSNGKPGSPHVIRTGAQQVLDHLVTDMNRDLIPDLAVFSIGASFIFEGKPPEAAAPTFRRGDLDTSGSVEITDAVVLLDWLFRGGKGPCEEAGDADDDGSLSLTDAILILRWLFLDGPAPEPPGPNTCGADPTMDGLVACAEVCR
jgi:hypothetical protein